MLEHKTLIFINTQSFGQDGGIATFNQNFLRTFNYINKYINFKNISLIKDGEDVNVSLIKKILRKLIFFKEIIRLISIKYDLVICGHVQLIYPCILLSIIKRKKLVLIIHGVEVWYLNKTLALFIDFFIYKYFSVSRYTKKRLEKQIKKKINCEFIFNCVNMEKFIPQKKKKSLLLRYSLTKSNKVVLFLGRLDKNEAYKGIDELIGVIPNLISLNAEIKLLICGSGSDIPRLKKKVNKSKLENSIKFAGYVHPEEIKDHYNLADCFAMPGYGEGFGIVYLEAMACGIPTLGSKLDGSKEALLNGRLGELVNPQNSNELINAILKCIKQPIRVNPRLEFFSEQNFQKRIIEKISRELGVSEIC